ncbi:cellulose biosynthesis protein BcsS [Pseudophaeobacter sp.]|uniref:cellulose biosynthesis protein BcsS n=1 Tax=Pseudophaeobacter sp. TaxID=1971739 RepID=UPI003297894A
MKTLGNFSKLVSVGVLSLVGFGTAATAQSTSVFTGVELAEDSYTIYGGLVTALNRDINSSGALLRFSAVYGEYEYATTGVPGGIVDIDGTSFDLMLGYQWVGTKATTSVYLGAEYRDNSLSPADPLNSTSGDETGVKAQFEVFSTDGSMPGSSLIASYSTAYDSYFVRGRLGFSAGSLHLGPEVTALGNDEFDATKVGVFLGGIKLGNSADLSLSLGYSDNSGSTNTDGIYGGIGVSFQF